MTKVLGRNMAILTKNSPGSDSDPNQTLAGNWRDSQETGGTIRGPQRPRWRWLCLRPFLRATPRLHSGQQLYLDAAETLTLYRRELVRRQCWELRYHEGAQRAACLAEEDAAWGALAQLAPCPARARAQSQVCVSPKGFSPPSLGVCTPGKVFSFVGFRKFTEPRKANYLLVSSIFFADDVRPSRMQTVAALDYTRH